MKPRVLKALKISAIVVACFVFIHLALSLVVNRLLHHRIEQRLVEQVQVLDGKTIRYGKINMNLLRGTVTVSDLYFNSTAGDSLPSDTLGFEISVDKVRVLKVDFMDILFRKDLAIRSVNIVHPQMSLNLNETVLQKDAKQVPLTERDANVSTSLNAGEQLLSFVARLNVDELRIGDASLRWRMLDSHLQMDVDSVSLAVDNLNFDFATQEASYGDSTYVVSVRGVHILTPDSLTYLEVASLETRNAGPIIIKDFTERSTVGYRELANRSHQPETWTKIKVKQVETSPINIIHQILDKQVTVDTLHAWVGTLTVFEDQRYKPKQPYVMPQEILMAVEVPLHINYVRASVDTLHYTLATTDIHDGSFELVNIKARVKNFSNRNREEFRVIGSTEFVGGGKADLQLTMKMSRACDWSIKLSGKGLRGSAFDGFLRPLFGLTANLEIDEVAAAYKGDKNTASGDFKMFYHGLEIHAYPGEASYDIINKNAKAIQDLGNAFLPKTNTKREYDVKATRDPMKKVPIYMLMPVIDGLKKTMLPGLFIQKKKQKTSSSK